MSKRSIDTDTDTDTVSKLRKVEIQIPEITSIEHFKEVCKTTTKDYIVFDFYATWCPPTLIEEKAKIPHTTQCTLYRQDKQFTDR